MYLSSNKDISIWNTDIILYLKCRYSLIVFLCYFFFFFFFHKFNADIYVWHISVLKIRDFLFVCLCWGLTSQSTIFQSCWDGATASWVINQYFRGVKCLAQGHNTAEVGFEPPTSRSGVRHSTTEPPRSPLEISAFKTEISVFQIDISVF